MRVTRRSFLQATALSGGGMMLGLYSAPKALAQDRPQPPFDARAFIRIAPDGTSTWSWGPASPGCWPVPTAACWCSRRSSSRDTRWSSAVDEQQ